MAEELNNEFDTQVRVQKAFVDATAKKVENHQALNDGEIKHLCPVAFKDTMTKAEIDALADLQASLAELSANKLADDSNLNQVCFIF